ncbi:phenoloxidase-activating enzyme 1-like [Cylas formicarius]|uniref:phenoloxidase-activating enzyme 1-like n=1 Tax=Cylas formicarius TaxID=197179 RepID=UPI002958BD7C|nr:phenoloxidase-activating enzyme 1-like [Cylas formicarius]
MSSKIALFAYIYAAVCSSVTLTEKCLTPNSAAGNCVILEKCPLIYKDSNDFVSPMTLERLNYLIASQCGFKGNIPKVCCPLEKTAPLKLLQA